MKPDHFSFPATVDIRSVHVGEIGEAIFNACYDPLEPIPAYLREFLRDKAPDWVDVDELRFQTRGSGKTYVIEVDGSAYRWKCDSSITTSFTLDFDDDEELWRKVHEKRGFPGWEYTFPIEIKTGGATLEYESQRTVMEHLAKQEHTQPIYVRLGIEDLPDVVTIKRFEFIG